MSARTGPLRAAVLVTGDEVLGGRVTEANAAHLARSLAAQGGLVERTLIVGDRLDTVRDAVRALRASGIELLCVTGGLGPTYDDLTMQAVAAATGRGLELDHEALALVEERSRGIRRQMQIADADLDAMRRKQATLPVGAIMLPPVGTAPGCVVADADGLVVVLPGPPNELQPMWEAACAGGPVHDLLARVEARPARTIRTWSVVEAELMTALNRLPEADLATIGTYTRSGELEIVVPEQGADAVIALLRDSFGDAVFAEHGELVEDIVAAALVGRRERLAVAESCTGGGLGARLTARVGASEWFDGGVIAYDNRVKHDVLGVPETVLASDGAVSEASAIAMAEGARRLTGAHWAVSITGIAGPGGGTPDKPVGLVWIGVAGEASHAVRHRFWSRDREAIRARAQTTALHALRIALMS